jgi:hypothetical protein
MKSTPTKARLIRATLAILAALAIGASAGCGQPSSARLSTPSVEPSATPSPAPTPGPAPAGAYGYGIAKALSPSIAVDPSGTPYVAYVDQSKRYKLSVQKWTGSAWALVGSAGFTPSAVDGPKIAFDRGGVPYVSFVNSSSFSLGLAKWGGASWALVDTPYRASQGSDCDLAFDSANNPIVAFKDGASSWNVSVARFAAASWGYLGAAGLSPALAYGPRLAVDSSGLPYVAYGVVGGSGVASPTLEHFDGSAWSVVGSPGFTPGTAELGNLAIDASDNLFYAFADGSQANSPISVMEYNGASWSYVGSPGISAQGTLYLSMALGASGHILVAYNDEANGAKPTLLKWDGSAWSALGAIDVAGAADTAVVATPAGLPLLLFGAAQAAQVYFAF